MLLRHVRNTIRRAISDKCKPLNKGCTHRGLKGQKQLKKQIPVTDGLRQMPIKPVYLVSSEHEGKKNIISVGMFALFSTKPLLVGVGIAPSRYSFEIIHKSREYVVNGVDERLMNAVRVCGEKSGRELDKFQAAKLTPAKAAKIQAPLIQESPVSIECKVVDELEVGDHVWFIGEVGAAHVREGFNWQDGLLFKWIGEEGVYYRAKEKVGEY